MFLPAFFIDDLSNFSPASLLEKSIKNATISEADAAKILSIHYRSEECPISYLSFGIVPEPSISICESGISRVAKEIISSFHVQRLPGSCHRW